MKGIYKITTPSGHIYIGQSCNLLRRRGDYVRLTIKSRQTPIHRSILKYGFNAHSFEIIHELPEDASTEVLTQFEQAYMDFYKEAGIVMLNISPSAGSTQGLKRSEESKRLQSIRMKGKPSPMKGRVQSEATRNILREKRKIQTQKAGHKTAAERAALKANTPPRTRKGFTISDQMKETISKKLMGRKLSPESIIKREETRRLNGNNKGWSNEARKRRSELYKGRKLSDEHKRNISLALIRKSATINS